MYNSGLPIPKLNRRVGKDAETGSQHDQRAGTPSSSLSCKAKALKGFQFRKRMIMGNIKYKVVHSVEKMNREIFLFLSTSLELQATRLTAQHIFQSKQKNRIDTQIACGPYCH